MTWTGGGRGHNDLYSRAVVGSLTQSVAALVLGSVNDSAVRTPVLDLSLKRRIVFLRGQKLIKRRGRPRPQSKNTVVCPGRPRFSLSRCPPRPSSVSSAAILSSSSQSTSGTKSGVHCCALVAHWLSGTTCQTEVNSNHQNLRFCCRSNRTKGLKILR